MGVITLALWGLQFLFAIWLHGISKWPEGTESRKMLLSEVHNFMGYSIYAMGLATCATGFVNMQTSDMAAPSETSHDEAVLSLLSMDDHSTMMDTTGPAVGANLASVGKILRSRRTVLLACEWSTLLYLVNSSLSY